MELLILDYEDHSSIVNGGWEINRIVQYKSDVSLDVSDYPIKAVLFKYHI